MRGKAKKLVYTLSALALSVVVFLAGLLFIRSNFAFASSQQQTSGGNTNLGNGSSGFDGVGSTDGVGSGTAEGGVGGENGSNTGTGNGDGSGPNDGPGDGGSGSIGPMPPTDELPENYLFRIYSQRSETVYLREENKGKYTGKGEHGFSNGATYEVTNGTPDPNEYFANMLSKNGYSSHYIDVELKADLLRLYPYYSDKIYESDVGIMQYRARTFAYQYNASTMRNLSSFSSYSSAWDKAEEKYYDFVEDNYLTIPSSLKSTLKNLAKKNGLNASSSTIITDVARYIQNAAYYDEAYASKNYPGDKDMVTYFLTEHKRGVCRHFAAAATMMYRALGIPARYTVGFRVDVQAGEWLIYGDDPNEEGHAWTEVYLKDYGWVAVEVTGNLVGDFDEEEDDSGTGGKDVIRISTNNLQKVYDGKPLFQEPEYSGTLQDGHTISISYPTLTDVGSIPNKPTVIIRDKNGNDCTDKAEITYNCGTLTVTPREITLTTGSKTATGVDFLEHKEYSVTGLVEGDEVYLFGLEFARLNSPGVCTNTVSYQSLVIENQSGKNVTANYIIKLRFGELILLE